MGHIHIAGWINIIIMIVGWKIHYDGIITGSILLGVTEFKRRTLDTTTRSQVNCANEVAVAVAVCYSRIPSNLLPVSAPASSKGLSEETQRIVDRTVARVQSHGSI